MQRCAQKQFGDVDAVQHVDEHSATCQCWIVTPVGPVSRCAWSVDDPEEVHNHGSHFADLAGVDPASSGLNLRQPQVVMDHREGCAHLGSRRNRRCCVCGNGGKRLLAQNVLSRLCLCDEYVPPQVLWRADVNGIDVSSRDQFERVAVDLVHREAGRNARCFERCLRRVGKCDHLSDVRVCQPVRQVESGSDVSAADDSDSKWTSGFSAELRSMQARGAFVDPNAGKIKFEPYAVEVLAARPDEASTRARDQSILRTHVLPEFGGRAMGSITHSEVQRWVTKLGTRRSPATTREAYRILHLVIKTAVRDRIIGHDPCLDVKVPKRKRRTVASGGFPMLSAEDFTVVLREVPDRHRLAAALAFGAGLRWGRPQR